MVAVGCVSPADIASVNGTLCNATCKWTLFHWTTTKKKTMRLCVWCECADERSVILCKWLSLSLTHSKTLTECMFFKTNKHSVFILLSVSCCVFFLYHWLAWLSSHCIACVLSARTQFAMRQQNATKIPCLNRGTIAFQASEPLLFRQSGVPVCDECVCVFGVVMSGNCCCADSTRAAVLNKLYFRLASIMG